ncbi:cytochrome P450 [Rhodobacteraceae bacterium CCMM004]|nr:cytochrome P450 [Rhodobacteraceae bacterium CCMM004]
MGEPRVVASPADIAAGLRHPDLKQALYDEGAVIMEGTVLTLHGEAHRRRRILEFRVFRKDFFHWYERTVFPATLAGSMAGDIAAGRSELVDLGYRVTMNLTADFAGVDRPEGTAEETQALLRLVETFSEGATLIHSTRPKDTVRDEVRAAIAAFEPQFLAPSVARRRALLDRLAAGDIDEDALPRDVLTVILHKGDPDEFTPDMLTREIAFYLQAGAHSTANSTIHAFHDIYTWAEADPARWARLRDDPVWFQRCVHESLRLHPASPVAWRTAMSTVDLPGAGTLEAGQTVEFRLAEANRDTGVFGADADAFNPHREVAPPTLPFGHTFGTGVHTCLGRDLDGGVVPRGAVDPETHQYGTIALFLRDLFARGARQDRDDPPTRATHTARPNWGRYPIVFDEARAWA